MKLIKLIIATALLYSTLGMAMEADLIISGKPGGSMAEYGRMYETYLEENGVSVKSQVLGSWSAGASQYELTENPSILIWASPVMAQSRQSGEISNFTIPDENFVSILTREYYMICSRADKNLGIKEFLNSDNAKFGYFSYHENFALQLDKFLNTATFNLIPYSGSSARMKGLVSGDVDYIFVSVKQGIQATQSGVTNCFITTSPSDNYGATSLKSIVPELVMNTFSVDYFILAKNFTEENMNNLRELTKTFVSSETWKKYLEKIKSDSVDVNNTADSARKSVDFLTPEYCSEPYPCK